MLSLMRLVVFALVASFGTASSAFALGPKTALRASSEIGATCVGQFAAQASGTRQENLSLATILASECWHGVEGEAQAIQQAGTTNDAAGTAQQGAQEATQVDKPSATQEADEPSASRFKIQTEKGTTPSGRETTPGEVQSRTDFKGDKQTQRVDYDHPHGDLGQPHVHPTHTNPADPSKINSGKPRAAGPGEYLSPVLSNPKIQGGVYRP